jgi:hypothetical protein
MSRLFALALLALATVANAIDRLPAENARIEYLLAVVASLHDAQFIRNGTAYDSMAAVKHLLAKLSLAGSRVTSAEDFIRYCGSQSSVSGKPYEIRFADGRVVLSADFLRQKLIELDTANGHLSPFSAAPCGPGSRLAAQAELRLRYRHCPQTAHEPGDQGTGRGWLRLAQVMSGTEVALAQRALVTSFP